MAQAKFSQSRNDMYWTHYDAQDGFIRWVGYDDQFWWDNVSKAEHIRTREGKLSGKVYEINFDTGEVTVSQKADA